MAWIYLIAAGILETLWAVAMKASNGFTLLIPSLITVFGESLSLMRVTAAGFIVVGLIMMKASA